MIYFSILIDIDLYFNIGNFNLIKSNFHFFQKALGPKKKSFLGYISEFKYLEIESNLEKELTYLNKLA